VFSGEFLSWAYQKFCVNRKGEKKGVSIYTIFMAGSPQGLPCGG